jgi:hypothetical protein
MDEPGQVLLGLDLHDVLSETPADIFNPDPATGEVVATYGVDVALREQALPDTADPEFHGFH